MNDTPNCTHGKTNGPEDILGAVPLATGSDQLQPLVLPQPSQT